MEEELLALRRLAENTPTVCEGRQKAGDELIVEAEMGGTSASTSPRIGFTS
jgi:hypothetical protein